MRNVSCENAWNRKQILKCRVRGGGSDALWNLISTIFERVGFFFFFHLGFAETLTSRFDRIGSCPRSPKSLGAGNLPSLLYLTSKRTMSIELHRVQGKYNYDRLADAVVCVDKKVNFYGIVAEYEQPKSTRGDDCLCTMTVVDMSYNTPGLRVLYFAPADQMPRVNTVGDIIRFHRIQMRSHADAPQAIGNPKYGASFVLLSGLEGDGYEPYQKSHSRYSVEAHDRDIVDLLRTWASSHPIDTFAGTNKYMKQIKDINVESYFDLCCKILYVNEQSAENSVIIYVWDGTDTSPACLNPVEQGESDDPGQDLWSAKELALPVDVMRSFPVLGTVLPLVPFDVAEDDSGPQIPLAGDWVKLRNIGCRIRKGLYEGIFLHKSKIGILSPSTQAVQNCERAYKERLTSETLRLPQWCPKPPQSMLVTGYDHVKVSTLREVLTHPQVTNKFRCMVRVMATWPTDVLDFCVPLPESTAGGKDQPEQGAFVYAVRFTLEDPTGRLHVFLYGQDAVDFFVGYPAVDLRQQGDTVGALKRKVDRLLGVSESGPSNPPWVNCCLMSYYLDKERPHDTRRFRIFGTRFPG
ncbi:protection of telomeres protein 1a isoform X2 [Physcomitrium patens]|uniref:Protection of telomeres protein 1 n=1 Tax=Physcomitrium patens TaxID=3218 RepID=A0A2K1J1Z1_PHYPA|nr:protection of telomeres protein 1a-like isoform X2 [Physcomitrium patens]PNR35549.1 hypothetical protein PHYPA_023449 [Physcomitrium patens]|eukprot:XP_024403183.1 protection of telomeres protein 1a-like isoform X2 [Physcomitrella patens]